MWKRNSKILLQVWKRIWIWTPHSNMDSTFESGLHIRIWTPHSNMDSTFKYGLHIQILTLRIWTPHLNMMAFELWGIFLKLIFSHRKNFLIYFSTHRIGRIWCFYSLKNAKSCWWMIMHCSCGTFSKVKTNIFIWAYWIISCWIPWLLLWCLY